MDARRRLHVSINSYDKKKLADDDCPGCACERLCFLFHRLVQAENHSHFKREPGHPFAFQEQCRRQPGARSITFSLEPPCKLTEIKVVPLAEWQTNQNAARLASGRRLEFRAGKNLFLRPAHSRPETRSAGRARRAAPAQRHLSAFRHRRESHGQHDFELKPAVATTLDRAGRFRLARQSSFPQNGTRQNDFLKLRAKPEFPFCISPPQSDSADETGSRRRMDRRRHIARQNDALPFRFRINFRHGGNQRLRVRMLRRADDFLRLRHSTILPRYITITRRLMCSTTARSCAMNRYAMPCSCCKSPSRLMICACTETSSALTGSSQMINSGSTASARAMPMRWRWPPENSCG
jgi:hypothetical protein